MKILSKITPAETLLIQDGFFVEFKDLMKFTFIDLLLKKIIKIKEVHQKPHPRDKHIRTYTYVTSGKNFKKYKPKNHELIYLSPFNKNRSLQILFKNFIKMAYDNSNGSWSYKKLTRSNIEINPYFKQTSLLNLFRINKLTAKGVKLKKGITNYLNTIDNNINHLLHEDKKKGLELLLSIGGNIFLLENLDFQLLKTIDKELLNQQKVLYNDTYNTDSDWWLYIGFFEDQYMFDSYFDDFDATLNSFNSEFDSSSCSSCDSGCSSCGGCD
ncbi:hypothetical protein [Psychroserpens sp. NJDZ02]|uniref:hypothetical protein n=1 Tax=Psychroserpens sp. NJDZ02 TaxID=2570561 RepID=UPI0010A948CC|nr:hypothetical protein [Psychroserpens sp. NJDZ02]QCE40953.1 hypothetical protein E9099_05815 [Psychroserpens sp. NJDZ02]